MIIAVDFDGTIVKHKFPKIGEPVPGATAWLRAFAVNGAKLILWTMRSGKHLHEARAYCEAQQIPLWGANSNPDQASWTNSTKAYAHLYIDDAAFGCPLVRPWSPTQIEDLRPYVDWEKVGPDVMQTIIRFRAPDLDLRPESVAKSLAE